MAVSSQIPLPEGLPFRIISRTIGKGAYASIKKACPLDAPEPVIAVKLIHREHAFKQGKVKPKQIAAEVALHNHVGQHQNIIQFMATGEDETWTWIAMELAEGDLFDKIEPDLGVGPDIAHFYFKQLISAVGYMHSRDVAHRDIKPENILLADGDLKLADFGLAVLTGYKGQKKLCQSVCGSPPYMAPEVVPKAGFHGHRTEAYEGNMADIWSCGIVLFVLLVGNTPWDEPTRNSYEFSEYVSQSGVDELWRRIPADAISLLRGMLRVDPKSRFTLENVRQHPWFTQPNPLMASDGRAANPLALATKMLENLHIDFTQPVSQSQRPSTANGMDMDDNNFDRVAMTQPETPLAEMTFDWELPARQAGRLTSASQPLGGPYNKGPSMHTLDQFAADPILSQFAIAPSVPITLTQQARRFRDIVPEYSLCTFLSFMDFNLLLPLISEAFAQVGIPVSKFSTYEDDKAYLGIKTRDVRNCTLAGSVQVERIRDEVLQVRFVKTTGDPLEWRRLFKNIAVHCKDGILRPDS